MRCLTRRPPVDQRLPAIARQHIQLELRAGQFVGAGQAALADGHGLGRRVRERERLAVLARRQRRGIAVQPGHVLLEPAVGHAAADRELGRRVVTRQRAPRGLLLAVFGVVQNHRRVGVGLPAGLPDLFDENIPVGADRALHVRGRLHHVDRKHPVLAARHIVAGRAGHTDLVDDLAQRDAEREVAGVGVGVRPDAVREVQIQRVALLREGDPALRVVDADIVWAEIQQPADAQPQEAVIGRRVLDHQRGIVQNAGGPGRYGLAV